jgi:hypothetical protein
MIDIADKIYAATGLTLGAEEAAAIGRMIQAENEKLRAALRELIYETTHLSPQEDDGSHRCTITGETLRKARAALGEKE